MSRHLPNRKPSGDHRERQVVSASSDTQPSAAWLEEALIASLESESFGSEIVLSKASKSSAHPRRSLAAPDRQRRCQTHRMSSDMEPSRYTRLGGGGIQYLFRAVEPWRRRGASLLCKAAAAKIAPCSCPSPRLHDIHLAPPRVSSSASASPGTDPFPRGAQRSALPLAREREPVQRDHAPARFSSDARATAEASRLCAQSSLEMQT
jgi:hypothetical protein